MAKKMMFAARQLYEYKRATKNKINKKDNIPFLFLILILSVSFGFTGFPYFFPFFFFFFHMKRVRIYNSE